MQLTTITIIGGGACGTAAFIELFHQLRLGGLHHSARIIIAERAENIGPGLAFGTQQKGHLLNTQANLMGIYAHEPDHFSRWLAARHAADDELKGPADPDEAYTTRRLYGQYLHEQFDRYRELAAKDGTQVSYMHDEVVQLHEKDGGWQVIPENEPAFYSDVVLLMPGTPDTNLYAGLKAHERYVPSPWPAQEMTGKTRPGDDVAIIGSGLSAIDAVMTLADNSHHGHITLFSPDGLLPRVQPVKDTTYQCQYLNLASIHRIERETGEKVPVKTLYRLYRQDVEKLAGRPLDWKATRRTGKPAAELLSDDISEAEKGGDALMAVAYATREYSSAIWQRISDAEKQKFQKWFATYWMITRHAMPLHNARRLQQLFAAGQLTVQSPLDDVVFDRTKSCFVLSAGHEQFTADVVVNAIGTSSDIEKMDSVLIAGLAKSGIIKPEKSGGISIDPATMQVIGVGGHRGSLYTAGHLANGILPDVNAVWFNVRCIEKLCRHLVCQMETSQHD